MKKLIYIGGAITVLMVFAHLEEKKAMRQAEKEQKAWAITPPERGGNTTGNGYLQTNFAEDVIQQIDSISRERKKAISRGAKRKTRGYNFETGGWINYSDEEIRIIREIESFKTEGTYIYTPGRHVPSRQEEIRDYIEDNIDDILDEYGN